MRAVAVVLWLLWSAGLMLSLVVLEGSPAQLPVAVATIIVGAAQLIVQWREPSRSRDKRGPSEEWRRPAA